MRYRVLAAAYVVVAAVGPLAFAGAALREAPAASSGIVAAAGSLAGPALALAACVAAVLLLALATDVVRLRRVKRRAVPFGRVAIRRARIGTSPTVATPTAIGYVHPAVVLPEGFRDRVDDREWDAVLAHECAHLARCDDWAKAVQSAVLRAGWWLPGLWVLSRALDLERELASDERAACETGARRYAACLLRLATARGTDAVAPGLWGRRSHVAIRVERLLRPVADGTPLLRAAALGVFTALVLAVVGAAALAVPGTAARAVPVAHALRARPVVVAQHPAPRHPARPAHSRRPAPAAHTVAFAAASSPAAGSSQAVVVARVLVRASATAARPSAVRQPPVVVAVAPPVRSAASHRLTARPASAGRRGAAPVTIAYVALPRPRCATCFGPLRSPDVAIPSPAPAAFSGSSGGGGGGMSAIAAGDPTSGPIDLTSSLIWYRIPLRAMQLP